MRNEHKPGHRIAVISDIPYTLEVELYGRKFFITHKKKDIPSDVDADVVIYGHSHRYAQDYIDGTLYLNPGSCGPRRFNQAITMAVLTVPEKDLAEDILADGGTEKKSYGITVERIDIPHAKAASTSGVVFHKSKSTSGVVCPHLWTNYPRGRFSHFLKKNRG